MVAGALQGLNRSSEGQMETIPRGIDCTLAVQEYSLLVKMLNFYAIGRPPPYKKQARLDIQTYTDTVLAVSCRLSPALRANEVFLASEGAPCMGR